MDEPAPRPRWAPRVRPVLIRRLYEASALHSLDQEALDRVGNALVARCRSILAATDALHGHVHCPVCATIIQRAGNDPAEVIGCPACTWSMDWSTYHQTFRHQELSGLGLAEEIQTFLTGWARNPAAPQKMLLIDQLIHAWHWQASADHQLGRPAGVNLIEGNRKQVLAFLDALSARP